MINIGTKILNLYTLCKLKKYWSSSYLRLWSDKTAPCLSFYFSFILRFILILSFKNENWKVSKITTWCCFQRKLFFGYEVCLRYIFTFVSVCMCARVQERNIEPQTHDVCVCARVCARVHCVHPFINVRTCKFIGLYKYICTILHV